MKRQMSVILLLALIVTLFCFPFSVTGATEFTSLTTEEILLELLESDIPISLLVTNRTYEEAYAHLRDFNPLLTELENRDDSASTMIKMIREMQTDNSDAVSISMLGILLSLPVHCNKITEPDRGNLNNLQPVEELVSTTVRAESNTPQTRDWLDDFIDSLLPLNGYDNATIDRYTLSGERIPLKTTQYEYSDSQKASYQADITEAFPLLTPYDSPTKVYNCHCYAWGDSSYRNQYWLNSIDEFLEDDHVKEIYDPEPGAICVYFDIFNLPLHSAIIEEVNGDEVICISKWGAMGLYEHEQDYVPQEYMYFNGRTHCRYYISPDNHTCVGPYNQSNDQYHTGICDVCGITINLVHTCTVTHTSLNHTLTCRVCGWSKTQRHSYDIGGKCTVCNYQGGIIPTPGM